MAYCIILMSSLHWLLTSYQLPKCCRWHWKVFKIQNIFTESQECENVFLMIINKIQGLYGGNLWSASNIVRKADARRDTRVTFLEVTHGDVEKWIWWLKAGSADEELRTASKPLTNQLFDTHAGSSEVISVVNFNNVSALISISCCSHVNLFSMSLAACFPCRAVQLCLEEQ